MNNLANAKDRERLAKAHHFRMSSVKPLRESFGFQTSLHQNCGIGYANRIEAM
jgi:hypothetical protein